MPFIPGENIGPYRLMEQLGQGGMATVFKAYHSALDRYVAIKVLHVAFQDDPNFLARFQREARVVARLDHQNIVPIYDYSEYESRPYLVMKYVDGETLKARLSRGKLSQSEIERVVEAVGAALAYAHKQNILHRDVKPSNVLLTEDGQIYLADFGLARMAQTSETSLTADRMVGTPQYMSPEQAQAKPDLDARSDIYSFGVMLYEMLVGRVPFNADTPFAVIHDHIYTPLPLPRTVNPDIPEQVERVLLKALAKDPDDRFDQVDQMVKAFGSALRGEYLPTGDFFLLEYAENTLVTVSEEETLVPTGAENLVSASAEASGKAGTDKAPKAQKRSRIFWIVGGLAGLLVIGLLAMMLVNRMQDRNPDEENSLVSVEENMVLDEPAAANPEEDAGRAETALEESIVAWRTGDLDVAIDSLKKMVIFAGRDRDFYLGAYQQMMDRGAWLLIAISIYDTDRPLVLNILTENSEAMHEVLYYAAEDPMARDFFMRHKDHPMFVVANARFELYNGDPFVAKEKLGEVLSTPRLLEKFPEADLLEVEIFAVMEDYVRARQELGNLLENNDLPQWIRDNGIIIGEEINF